MKSLSLPFELWEKILSQIQEKAVFYAIAKCSKDLFKAGADIIQKRFLVLSSKHNASIFTASRTIFITLNESFTCHTILDKVSHEPFDTRSRSKRGFPSICVTSNWNTKTNFTTHCRLEGTINNQCRYGVLSTFKIFFAVEHLCELCIATYKCQWCGEVIQPGSTSLQNLLMDHKKCKSCDSNHSSVTIHDLCVELQEPWYYIAA